MNGASALARLIQETRKSKRPKWSQQFLADELTRQGCTTTREQIARIERMEAGTFSDMTMRVALGAAIVLGIPRADIVDAYDVEVIELHDAIAQTLKAHT